MTFGVHRTRILRTFTAAAIAFALALTFSQAAFAQDAFDGGGLADASLTPASATSGASIGSDKADYGPGEMVYLTGAGWQAGESVRIVVDDDGLQADAWHRDVTVTADADGNVTDEFELPPWFVANYTVTATGTESGTATATFTDAIKATASVNRTDAYRSRSNEAFNFTVVNTADGTTSNDQGRRVRITAPAGVTMVSCGTTRSGWSGTAVTGGGTSECVYSNDGTSNPLAPGSSESFNTTASIAAGSDSASTWAVRLGPNAANNGGQVSATVTPGGSLALNLSAIEVTDAVIAGSASTIGSACPSPNKTATASSSRVIVVCGRTGVAGPSTPQAANSSLGGTMIGTAGTFASSSITGPTATSVVLANYSATSMTSSAGTGKTITASIGSAANQTSPSTTFNGYEATPACTAPSVTTHPGAQSITYGANATFSAAANGTAPVSVQWQRSTNGTTWTDISGENSTTLTLTKPAVSASGTSYRAVFSNACGSKETNAAALTVAKKSVTGSFTVPASKVYDGTADATITDRSLSGAISGDAVSLSGGSASYNNKNVGTGKPVNGTGFTLAGADSANYSLASSSLSTTADITRKAVAGHFTAEDKTYDGTTAAAIASRSVTGQVEGDKVDLSGGTAAFENKSAGKDKTVNGSGFALSGDDAGNYALASSSLATTASISAKALTGKFTAADKTYNGTDEATITGSSLEPGAIAGDDVSIDDSAATAKFDDATAGEDKTVTGTGFTLAGDDSANYTLSSVADTTASIKKKGVTGSFTAENKEYDGTAGATIASRALDGALEGDDVALSGGSASFTDKNVGQDKTVNGTGFGLTGDDADNYSLASSALSTTADITAKTINGSFTAYDKVYDGLALATINERHLSGTIEGDDISLIGGSATFDDKKAGQDKPVHGTGFQLDGADKGNYTLASSSLDTTANITQKELNGSFTANDREYDGTTAASIAGRSLDHPVAGDDVSLSGGSASFEDKNAGTGKTVNGTGFGLTGSDADNYTLASSSLTTTAAITRKTVHGNFSADDKEYDGDAHASITGSSLGAGVVSGDDLDLDGSSATASFDNRNAGTGKPVTSSGFALKGDDRGNYTLAMNGTTASISRKPVSGSFTAANKPYDGNLSASISGRALSGAISGDAVSLAGGSASFNNKNVGTGKPVSGTGFSLAGGDRDNYSLGSVSDTTANITPKAITGGFTAADKVFDGDASATIVTRSLSGAVTGDNVSLAGGTASFDNPSVGQNKTVTGSGFSLAGTDGGNYTLSSVSTTTASIVYASASASCLGAPGRTILQPINVDGSSIVKQGSTVPAKFRVCDAQGRSIGTPGVVSSFALVGTSTATSGAVNEPVDSTTPDTSFRWSATDQQWIFNISTKSLKSGVSYRYRITLNDGTFIDFRFSLK